MQSNKTFKMKVTIEITDRELRDLKRVRNYFGEHDKTMFEHAAYAIVNSLVKKLEYSADNKEVCVKIIDK